MPTGSASSGLDFPVAVEQSFALHFQQSVQVGDHEIGILEVSQRTEAQEDGQHKKQLRPFRAAEALNKTPKDIALQDGAEHNRQITRLTPAVKHKA